MSRYFEPMSQAAPTRTECALLRDRPEFEWLYRDGPARPPTEEERAAYAGRRTSDTWRDLYALADQAQAGAVVAPLRPGDDAGEDSHVRTDASAPGWLGAPAAHSHPAPVTPPGPDQSGLSVPGGSSAAGSAPVLSEGRGHRAGETAVAEVLEATVLEPDHAADEAQADATATLRRWGADPAETAVMDAAGHLTGELEPLPQDAS